MKPIKDFPKKTAKNLKYIFHDIDDTITTNGKLSKVAYNALWDLHEKGYVIIPVTGRPAGWCDQIIRQWPVDAVIGENGAFVYYFSGNQLKTFTHPLVRKDVKDRLKEVEVACLKGVSGCRVSKDQPFRMYDLAIDFNEDPPYLGFEAAEKIKQICESYGAIAKISSIHVNTWFGNYDKVSMAKLFLNEVIKDNNFNEKSIFFGDSPNDEPMFKYFKTSCGVANINPFKDSLMHLPQFVTEETGGEGFFEAIEIILKLKEN